MLNEMRKYADDIYLIIPALKIDSQEAELYNIDASARAINLNRCKTEEIIFVDSKRRRQSSMPSQIARVARIMSLKILGVTIASKVAVREHRSSHHTRSLFML